MIANWDYHSLRMDYSSMFRGEHPSDIDMYYLCRDGRLVLGEIKNEKGFLSFVQRRLLERLAEGWSNDAVVLYITHDSYWQKGDRTVDVGNCLVQEIYYKQVHKWVRPKEDTTVKQVIDYYMGGNK